jgi:hypothetical protein
MTATYLTARYYLLSWAILTFAPKTNTIPAMASSGR